MLGGNTYVTVWNRTGDDFIRHEIGVLCRHTQKSKRHVSGSGSDMSANIASTIVLRIPYIDTYLSPEIWQELPDEEKPLFFTVQTDDYLSLGLQKFEIGENGLTVPQLREKLQHLIIQARTISYSLHTRLGKHIRVEGV